MSEARRIGELIPPILERARRVAIIGEMVSTFDCPEERKRVVMRFYEAGIISDETAVLLIEHFGLEAA